MEYTILTDDEPDNLSMQVNRFINEGWEPLGGVSVSLSESDEYRYAIFAQAMIKREIVVTRGTITPQFAEDFRATMATIAIP